MDCPSNRSKVVVSLKNKTFFKSDVLCFFDNECFYIYGTMNFFTKDQIDSWVYAECDNVKEGDK